ncbi:MAG: hypothetical protein QNJ29_12995 [Rhizobiaceae bacterium]|nr:hypothetical protein [Rhizobiaceae bacterium]
MKSIDHCWFQRADFDSPSFKNASFEEALREFEAIDWVLENQYLQDLEQQGADNCPPGFGLVEGSHGFILHLMPQDTQKMNVTFHFPKSKKLLGFIPWSSTELLEAFDVPFFVSRKLMQLMFDRQYEAISAELIHYER